MPEQHVVAGPDLFVGRGEVAVDAEVFGVVLDFLDDRPECAFVLDERLLDVAVGSLAMRFTRNARADRTHK